MAIYNLPYTGPQTQEYLAKARDFSGTPLDDGLYIGAKTYTNYQQYLNDNGALFKANPTTPLPYPIDTVTYPEAKDDPNLIPYSDFQSSLINMAGYTEAVEASATVDASKFNFTVVTAGGQALVVNNIPEGAYTLTVLVKSADLDLSGLTIKWFNGEVPTFSAQDEFVYLSTIDQGVNWYGTPSKAYY